MPNKHVSCFLSDQDFTDPDYVRYLLITVHYAGGIQHPEEIKKACIKQMYEVLKDVLTEDTKYP